MPNELNDDARPIHGMRLGAWFALVYVAAVLLVDTLAYTGAQWPIDWTLFAWRGSRVPATLESWGVPELLLGWMSWRVLQGFDYFKFLFWFLIPFLICVWHMDWGALGWKRWKRIDLYLFGGALVLLAAAVFIMPLFPDLRAEFPSYSNRPASWKWMYFFQMTFWNISWLLGWEFMHRYFLLRRLDAQWPKYGWLIVPFLEIIYHYRSIALMGGMGIFAVLATIYARERKNILLPFLAHMFIELFLVVFMLLV